MSDGLGLCDGKGEPYGEVPRHTEHLALQMWNIDPQPSSLPPRWRLRIRMLRHVQQLLLQCTWLVVHPCRNEHERGADDGGQGDAEVEEDDGGEEGDDPERRSL